MPHSSEQSDHDPVCQEYELNVVDEVDESQDATARQQDSEQESPEYQFQFLLSRLSVIPLIFLGEDVSARGEQIGRRSMIICAEDDEIYGNASNSSSVAVFRSMGSSVHVVDDTT